MTRQAFGFLLKGISAVFMVVMDMSDAVGIYEKISGKLFSHKC